MDPIFQDKILDLSHFLCFFFFQLHFSSNTENILYTLLSCAHFPPPDPGSIYDKVIRVWILCCCTDYRSDYFITDNVLPFFLDVKPVPFLGTLRPSTHGPHEKFIFR